MSNNMERLSLRGVVCEEQMPQIPIIDRQENSIGKYHVVKVLNDCSSSMPTAFQGWNMYFRKENSSTNTVASFLSRNTSATPPDTMKVGFVGSLDHVEPIFEPETNSIYPAAIVERTALGGLMKFGKSITKELTEEALEKVLNDEDNEWLKTFVTKNFGAVWLALYGEYEGHSHRGFYEPTLFINKDTDGRISRDPPEALKEAFDLGEWSLSHNNPSRDDFFNELASVLPQTSR